MLSKRNGGVIKLWFENQNQRARSFDINISDRQTDINLGDMGLT